MLRLDAAQQASPPRPAGKLAIGPFDVHAPAGDVDVDAGDLLVRHDQVELASRIKRYDAPRDGARKTPIAHQRTEVGWIEHDHSQPRRNVTLPRARENSDLIRSMICGGKHEPFNHIAHRDRAAAERAE